MQGPVLVAVLAHSDGGLTGSRESPRLGPLTSAHPPNPRGQDPLGSFPGGPSISWTHGVRSCLSVLSRKSPRRGPRGGCLGCHCERGFHLTCLLHQKQGQEGPRQCAAPAWGAHPGDRWAGGRAGGQTVNREQGKVLAPLGALGLM